MEAILIDKKVKLIGKPVFCGDSGVDKIHLKFPCEYNGVRLENLPVYVKTQNALGERAKVLLTAAKSGDNLLIDWLLDKTATAVAGDLNCQIAFENAEGDIVFNTDIFILEILPSVSDGAPLMGYQHNQVTQLQNKLQTMLEEAQAAVDNANSAIEQAQTVIQEDVIKKGDDISLLNNDSGFVTDPAGIIDVETLPTENIKENVIYRTPQKFCFISIDSYSKAVTINHYGGPLIPIVSQIQPEYGSESPRTIWYKPSSNEIKAYYNGEWVDAQSILGESFKGVIRSQNHMLESDAVESGNAIYFLYNTYRPGLFCYDGYKWSLVETLAYPASQPIASEQNIGGILSQPPAYESGQDVPVTVGEDGKAFTRLPVYEGEAEGGEQGAAATGAAMQRIVLELTADNEQISQAFLLLMQGKAQVFINLLGAQVQASVQGSGVQYSEDTTADVMGGSFMFDNNVYSVGFIGVNGVWQPFNESYSPEIPEQKPVIYKRSQINTLDLASLNESVLSGGLKQWWSNSGIPLNISFIGNSTILKGEMKLFDGSGYLVTSGTLITSPQSIADYGIFIFGCPSGSSPWSTFRIKTGAGGGFSILTSDPLTFESLKAYFNTDTRGTAITMQTTFYYVHNSDVVQE